VAVGTVPNARFLAEEIERQLKLIKRPDFYADVATVQMPSYEPLSQAMWAADTPSLHVWVTESGVGDSKVGMPRRTLVVWIGGVVKQDRELQENLIELAESVRAVMLFKLLAVTALADMGVFVIEESEGIAFQLEKQDGGFAGMFLSKWRVEYDYPSPAG